METKREEPATEDLEDGPACCEKTACIFKYKDITSRHTRVIHRYSPL